MKIQGGKFEMKEITVNSQNELENMIEEYDKVIVWGAGDFAKHFVSENNIDIDYFVDKDSKKQNKKFMNYDVYDISKIKEEIGNIIIIITSISYTEIMKELEEIGYKGSIIWAHTVNYDLTFADTADLELNALELKSIMADDKSKEIIDIIIKKRKMKTNDYREICEGEQYFVENIIKPQKDAVFLDAGAYLGETVEQFIEFQNNEFEQVYSFEMDIDNYEKIKKENFDDRVKFLNYGLWNKKMILKYDSNSTSSVIGNQGSKEARCILVDELLKDKKITFIKMDIEGAEINALEGAKECIIRNKPQLAICVYHKPNDIWKIPFMLKEWVPDYKFYLRHHSDVSHETVLYATIS